MNLKVELLKEDNMDEALEFLALETMKLQLELNPDLQKIYDSHTKLVEDMFLDEYFSLDKQFIKIYGAYLDQKLVGVGYIENDNTLDSLYVKDEYRNKKVGTTILNRIIKDLAENQIIRVEAILKSISLYKKLNFKLVNDSLSKGFVTMELERSSYGR